MTDALNPIPIPDVRKGQGDVTLSREEFARRPLERFDDPAFEALRNEVERIIEAAWSGYVEYRKSPRTRKAGYGFANPEFELPIEWLDTRARIFSWFLSPGKNMKEGGRDGTCSAGNGSTYSTGSL